MTGSLVHRGGARWALVLNELRDGQRKQKWISFRATAARDGKMLGIREQRKEAQAKLTELLNDQHKGTFVEPSKLLTIDYLRAWLETSVKPPMRRPATYATYLSLIETHIATAPIGAVPLQQLPSGAIERFYAGLKLSPASVGVLHAIFSKSMRKAVKDRLLQASPAVDLERQRSSADHPEAREHCWSAIEARRVLEAAKVASPQMAAFIFLALDSGARKSELFGLGWEHVDLESGTLTIARQLDKAGVEPVFGPTKTKRTRGLTLGAETIARLRAHKAAQATLKMANRTSYSDFGLIFAKEPEDLQTQKAALGQALTTLSEGRFEKLVAAAEVKRIKFHGCRHTVATLLLQAGTPPHVVAARLGHSVMMLLRTYAHALPNQQQDAASRLGALLHG